MKEPPTANDEAELPGGRPPSTERRVWTDVESLAFEVVHAVAKATDTDPNELGPLYETIDPDALTDLLRTSDDDSRATSEITISFQYADCDVTVYSSGTIVAKPTSTERPGRRG